jgi:nucleotide-binding universal stress UspA family protein
MYPEIKTILYATDLGEYMPAVFRFTLGIAKQHQAGIIMLHVAEPLSSGVQLAINVYMPRATVQKVLQDGMSEALAKMQERLSQFCEDVLADCPEDRELIEDMKVVSGRPAETIIQQAAALNADLIVVGTHTDPSLGAQLLGSTARNVTQLSKRTPVLVVPVYV